MRRRPPRSQPTDTLLPYTTLVRSLFAAERETREAVADVGFFEVVVEQPLDERWPEWPGCLAGEADWTSYTVTWGVLAASESEAHKFVEAWQARRSEEHTSELQSLMRISYAVFCLKKKKTTNK